jgi:hypothetical protein
MRRTQAYISFVFLRIYSHSTSSLPNLQHLFSFKRTLFPRMKLSTTSIVIILAATSQVAAWYGKSSHLLILPSLILTFPVTFYDNTERCKVDGETEYQILEGDKYDCHTFGASMDGVDCVHFVEGGRNRKGCKGLFKAQSAKPKLNTNSYCTFYPYADCRELSIRKDPGQCATTLEMSTVNGQKPDYIASFRCVSLSTNLR